MSCGAESLIPPLLAISLALITKEVIFSLLTGVVAGSMLFNNSVISGTARVFDTYILKSLASPSHGTIIIFTMALGGMVGVISRSGGTKGIVDKLVVYAKSPKSGQLATWFMGLFIFFDGLANTLVVGNTMRPLTDKLKISREKLAYIVDSTSAPVASLALISTWIGYEVSLIDDAFTKCGITQFSGYSAFLESIPYRFYGILTLTMVFLIAYLCRDFGPMAEAEILCKTMNSAAKNNGTTIADFEQKDLLPPAGTPYRWYNAAIPVAILILMTMYGLYYTGCENTDQLLSNTPLRTIISNADSSKVLLWSSFLASFIAIILPIIQGIGGNLSSFINAWVKGATSMAMAAIILVLAWSLGTICKDMGTASFIAKHTIGIISPWALPALTFIIASVMAFATGTSWGTMSIVIPLVIPLAHQMGITAHLPQPLYNSILLGTIGGVLSGACFGDHCSPISDTTIMSSVASGCDHVEHVKTQMPYALTAGIVAIICCYIPAGLGFSPLLLMATGIVIIGLIVRFIGRPTSEVSNIEENESRKKNNGQKKKY